VLLILIVSTAVFGPLVLPHDPNDLQLTDAFKAPSFSGGFRGHPLGTDPVGRDILARLVTGARISLLVGAVGASGTATIGCTIGLVAGWCRGLIGAFLMRLADLQLAFPFLLFAITVSAVLGSGLKTLLIIFTIWSWGGYARIAEGLTLSLSRREFVEAARAIGASTPRILFKHILPQLTSPILVLWSFSFAGLIIAEASLSFLGMGIRPPTASWGSMLAGGRQYLRTAWWLLVCPGLAITITVWTINTLGDRFRDSVDRRLHL
jgi:peptide/nickel transport system permease protein